jgi:hypothetical protein
VLGQRAPADARGKTALIDYLQQHVLSDGVLSLVPAEVRREIAAQIPKHDADTAALQGELVTARTEQKRLAKAEQRDLREVFLALFPEGLTCFSIT